MRRRLVSIASIVNAEWKSQIVDIVDLLLNRHCSEQILLVKIILDSPWCFTSDIVLYKNN